LDSSLLRFFTAAVVATCCDIIDSTTPNAVFVDNMAVLISSYDDVLTYWFSGTDEERKTRHWKGLKETDDEIRQKFAATWCVSLFPSCFP